MLEEYKRTIIVEVEETVYQDLIRCQHTFTGEGLVLRLPCSGSNKKKNAGNRSYGKRISHLLISKIFEENGHKKCLL
jgi:hypothetical protein